MKKNIFRLFVSFLLVFVLASNVEARVLECTPESKKVTITETGITGAGFDVKVPICKLGNTPTGETPVGSAGSREEAYNSGLDLVTKYFEAADAKGYVLGSVPLCSNNKRRVVATTTCTATSSPTYHSAIVCAGRSQENCTGVCSWVENEEGTGGSCSGYRAAYWTCPSGYEPSGNQSSKPTCTKSYSIDKEVAADINAVSECESATGGTCSCEPVVYTLICPTYSCDTVYKNVSACTPDFIVDGEPAYCVNPSQGFNEGTSNYQHDETFDVRQCVNSYNTVDCGFGNILIEGAYYNVDDDAINLALRLWGVHAGQLGYDKTGLANRIGNTCNEAVYYMKDGDKYANVYYLTHQYIMEHFYDIAKTKEYIPDYISETKKTMTGETFTAISCDSTAGRALVGVACGSKTTYRIAFELFFNTVIGNKYMQEHLDALYGNGEGVKPIGAQLIEITEEERQERTETWVEVSFEREDFDKVFGDEEVIDCKHLEKYTEAQRNQIKPYCEVYTKVIDSEGNVVDEGNMDICIKNTGCRRVTTIEAICSPVNEGYKLTKIEVTYERDRSSWSVRKYVSCSNPNENQIMFAFFDEDESGEGGSHYGDPREVDRKVTTETFYITNYLCGGGCKNYAVRKPDKNTNTCSTDDNNYDGVYTSSLRDPSLSCIVNMESPTERQIYDYSKYFGVNTNFCRVFCSDEVEYYLADKVRSISGRPFEYDIRSSAHNTQSVDKKLSSVVREKRSCVSEIYFDSLPKDVDWKRIYGLENDEMPTTLSWSNLFTALVKKALKEGSRTENLNQMIYDLYNCNFYAQSVFNSRGITQPRDNTTGNVLEHIKSIYSEGNNYGIVDVSTDTVSFGFGAKIEGTASARVGLGANAINATSNFSGSRSGIKYCSDTNGRLCLSYNANDEQYEYTTFSNTSAEQNRTVSANGKRIKLNNKVNYDIKIPTNDYAMFTVTTEVNFYNDEVYQTVPNTGNVVKGNTNADLLTLDKYVYPVDKYAYNLDECNITLKDGTENVKGCPVTQTLNVATFKRNSGIDPLQSAMKTNNKFNCYVKVDPPTVSPCKDIEKCTLYRNVDESNLFPNNIAVANNWATPEGQAAIEFIQENSEKLRTTDELLEYRITLNPTQIKAIKEYNRKAGSYINESTHDCDTVDDMYLNCKCEFMDTLRGNNTEYPTGSLGNIDFNHQDGLNNNASSLKIPKVNEEGN